MSSTGRAVLRFCSLISPLTAAVVTLALLAALLVGVVMAAGNFVSSPDTVGDVGRYTSLVLDSSGNPVVAYFDSANGDLKVLRCGNPNCSSGNTITLPDTAGEVGLTTSLVLDGDGNPVVAYFDSADGDLKVLHCGNPICGAGNVITSPDTVGNVGLFSSLALDGSGNPVVSYLDFTNGDLKVLHCGDPNCSTGNVITSPDTAGEVGVFSSLVLDGSGNPVISHTDLSTGNLKVLHCGDSSCSSGNVITSPETSVFVSAQDSSLVLDGSGNPVVSYQDHNNRDLKVLHCGNPNCSAGNVITSPDTAGEVGLWTSLVLDGSGNPVVSYYDFTNGDLKVLHCGDSSCSSGNVITSPDLAGRVGLFASLVLDNAGNPVVSYWDEFNDDLKILHCGDPDCSTAVGGTVELIAGPRDSADAQLSHRSIEREMAALALALAAAGVAGVSWRRYRRRVG